MKILGFVTTIVVTLFSLASANPSLVHISDIGFDYTNDGEVTAYVALGIDAETEQLIVQLDDEAIAGSFLPDVTTNVPASDHDNVKVINLQDGVATLPYGYAGKFYGIKLTHDITAMDDVSTPYLEALKDLGFTLTEISQPIKSSLVYSATLNGDNYTIVFDRVSDGISVRIASDIYSS